MEGGRGALFSDGVLALSSPVFSGQEQLLKCYPTIQSKYIVFHNWLSCPMFCFTVARDPTLALSPLTVHNVMPHQSR